MALHVKNIMSNNLNKWFRMELAFIIAPGVIVRFKKMEDVPWWNAKFVIINGAGFVVIARMPFFISLLRQVYVSILIIWFLDLNLIMKINTNVAGFFVVLLFFCFFLLFYIWFVWWFYLLCHIKNSVIFSVFLVIQGWEKRIRKEEWLYI